MSIADSTASVEYRTITRYVGYRFGSDGSIWSSWRLIHLPFGKGTRSDQYGSWKALRLSINTAGYIQAVLKNDVTKGRDICLAHRMILEAFTGTCPRGMECRHLDGCRTNNALSNLNWGTSLENAKDRYSHKTVARKLQDEQIREIRYRSSQGKMYKDLAAEYGVCINLIGLIVRREIWRDL